MYQDSKLLAHRLSLVAHVLTFPQWAKYIQFRRYFAGNLTIGRETNSTGVFLDPKTIHVLVIMFLRTVMPVGILLALTQCTDADCDT